MKTNEQQLKNLFLSDPQTGEDLIICSDFKHNKDGSYSFEVSSKDNKRKWEHTIRTEELFIDPIAKELIDYVLTTTGDNVSFNKKPGRLTATFESLGQDGSNLKLTIKLSDLRRLGHDYVDLWTVLGRANITSEEAHEALSSWALTLEGKTVGEYIARFPN